MIVRSTASIKNWSKISRFLAPIAFLSPISLVLSETATSMMFIIPIPPTIKDIPAIRVINNVKEIDTVPRISEACAELLTTKSSLSVSSFGLCIPWRYLSSAFTSVNARSKLPVACIIKKFKYFCPVMDFATESGTNIRSSTFWKNCEPTASVTPTIVKLRSAIVIFLPIAFPLGNKFSTTSGPTTATFLAPRISLSNSNLPSVSSTLTLIK